MEGAIVTSDRFICPNCDKAVQDYIMVYWGRLAALREYRVGDDFDWIQTSALLSPSNRIEAA